MTRAAALDGLNFSLADSASVLGPYLGIYLLTVLHWDQAAIGLVAMAGGLAGIAAQIPAGAAVDATRAKRATLVAGLGALSLAATLLVWWPTTPVIVGVAIVVALVGALQGPVVAALTLGLFEPNEFARRMGRNAAFDHAGNVFTALAVAVVGSLLSQRSVFLLVPVLSLAAAVCVLGIRPESIDHERARGGRGKPLSVANLLANRHLVVFAACIALFHLANAAMLPLVGQRLALAHAGYESAMLSACIVGAQMVMLPVALLCGVHADRVGRKPFLMAGFVVLALRGLLYTVTDAPAWLLGVQMLDGIGAGVLGVLVPLQVADLTEGSGRYNVSLAAVAMLGGIGAALSNGLAGIIVARASYDWAFTSLSLVALAGLVLLWARLPETAPPSEITLVAGSN
ncbi:MAG TPA: MFS transporter [Reyranella sp.]|jgi:MFS family permease|nr:MFS transporter [Reyranella sp.]